MMLILAAALASCGDGASNTTAVSVVGGEPPTTVAAATPVAEPTATPTAAAVAAPAAAEDFATVWARFRTAVLDNDAATIRSLSAPTVEQRGELDSTPVVKLTPAKVPAAIAAMMKAPSGEGTGTAGDALAAYDATPKADTATWGRVGDFEFTRTAAGWRLSAFFYEPDMG